MSFFEIPPPDAEEDQDQFTDDASDEPAEGRWLGGVEPVEELIGVSAQAAVGVRRIVAFPDGSS